MASLGFRPDHASPRLSSSVAGRGNRRTEPARESTRDDTPVVAWVESIFNDSIRQKASDLHLEPFEHELTVRLRIDGVLVSLPSPPSAWTFSIVSRVKVLANLDISERRLPQDGRIALVVEGRSVDLRVSTLATVYGESIVVRILDRAAMNLELENLGMPDEVLQTFRELLFRPSGLLIVTGPTGSGKTTTLYSALNLLNRTELKLLTAEDPVEYELEGVIQTSVNPSVGLTFATALRSFLRQDPDVIMVGEIRDTATAVMAIQAALTGHLVISTLHTQDAAGAVARLVDLGVEPFLVSAALVGVLGQRLVRRICPACRTAYRPDEDIVAAAQQPTPTEVPGRFFRGVGCEACNGAGYRGRRGLFELLVIDGTLAELIANPTSGPDLKRAAVERGMRSLRATGVDHVYSGCVQIDDVLAHT